MAKLSTLISLRNNGMNKRLNNILDNSSKIEDDKDMIRVSKKELVKIARVLKGAKELVEVLMK